MTLTTSWVSNGQTKTVETECRPGEDTQACIKRHEATVAEWQKVCPPD